ncbi:MAG: hypothetical protein QOD41_1129 [Cryptosporangiaceae bacterium]|nr:hypothetical protein [Cryptosporangiaceae bacterium]
MPTAPGRPGGPSWPIRASSDLPSTDAAPNAEPAAVASNSARRRGPRAAQPRQVRVLAPATVTTTSAAVSPPVRAAGRAGSAARTITQVSPVAVSPACHQAARTTRTRCASAWIGSAASSVSVPSACTTPTDPKCSATPCSAAPTPVSATARGIRPAVLCWVAARSWATAATA